MSIGDPGEGGFDGELMAMAQLHEGDEDLIDPEKECLKMEDHSITNPPVAETGDSKIQELIDEITEKLQKEVDQKDKCDLNPNSGNGCDSSNDQINTKMEESLEKGNRLNRENPMLLSPVIRSILKFLNMEDIKNCRLVCRDWGSIGKPALASLTLIRFHKSEYRKTKGDPMDFQSCFQDSTSNFSAFEIEGTSMAFSQVIKSWTVEELTKFFDGQQKYIKELTLHFQSADEELVKKIDLGSWISKSPMVKNDAKYLTKLTIEGAATMSLNIRPLHLIAHIKDLSLSYCRIHVEAGIKISSTKIKLDNAAFYEDGNKLESVLINDMVDLVKTKEVSLQSGGWGCTKYVLDLWGSFTFEKLILCGGGIELLNRETSQWVIEHLAMIGIPYYFLNSQVQIKELVFSCFGRVDLLSLPTSIQKLVLYSVNRLKIVRCSQPIVFPNLQYLQIVQQPLEDFSFLSRFNNCPQLTHLGLHLCTDMELKSTWISETMKTLTLENCGRGLKFDESHWNLEKLVVHDFSTAQQLCETKIVLDDFIVYLPDISVDKRLGDFLQLRKRFSFGKRLYVGELKWKDMQFAESVLFDQVDVKSAFYVFENGQKGRAVSKQAFHHLIPKHIDVNEYLVMFLCGNFPH